MQLDPAAAAAGMRLAELDAVGSTNTEAFARARAGDPGPLWIVAREQTAGRGRRGRTWASPPGNLYASLLLTDPSPPPRAAELSFVAALALHDAISLLAPAVASRLALKWPNDLLGDGAKLAGILVEGEGTGIVVAAIGIGVNCAHHPAGTGFPATDLAAMGAPASPDALFTALSGAMAQRLNEWRRGEGFAAIRAAWLARAVGLGKPVRVALAGGQLEGCFEALDPAGRLVLRKADGSSATIAAGEVFPIVTPVCA